MLTCRDLDSKEQELLRDALYTKVAVTGSGLFEAAIAIGQEWGVRDPLYVVESTYEQSGDFRVIRELSVLHLAG